ncbi:MAG: 30S ribosomal protein S12 methylthiotransferase RimO [Bacillota bacterium]|jgi:ribosomal protein S12 methylthiotransferase|nr:30S ribosomal protein S12 methylthiotransferase RimO [Bacillota bacterium]
MPAKLACISLGCPKNLIDSEIMLGMLNRGMFEITTDIKNADIIIVNTCAFIDDAKEEAVDTILGAAALKKYGKLKVLAVTGCLAQRYREGIVSEIPEVDVVLGTGNIADIQRAIEGCFNKKPEKRFFIDEPRDIGYLENTRMLSGSGSSQYLKIAEGCSNHCTYCVIPLLRGPFRSRTAESIVKEAEYLAGSGAKELILIAQDVSRYGEDLYGESRIVELIRMLSDINGVKWIRLLYCYPERITDELIAEFNRNPKLLKYLDIPIQHASDKILKLMGRKCGKNDLVKLLTKLRKEVPDIILRTTLITGFPGETEEDFEILIDFIKKYKFDRLGVFAYSREEDTPAYTMKNQVDDIIKSQRRDRILVVQQKASEAMMKKRIGKAYEVLVEGVADDGVFYYGRSYAEAPEIDPVIYFTSPDPVEAGDFVTVKIASNSGMDLIGYRQ